jgi:alkylhydroperoxidase/carboxymuconolactone decarboxylase family protein YurZ
MVVSVTARNAGGVLRHAQLAAEVGASWEELVAAIVLTEPTFGVLAGVEALPAARAGYEAGLEALADELEDDGS